MYIEVVPNRRSRPAVLLREGVREGKRIRKRTLANLSSWPAAKVDSLRRVLAGEILVSASEALKILRTRPHGHVAAVLGTVRRLALHTALASRASRHRDLVVAMIVARIIDPCSKLAMARSLGADTRWSTLAEVVGVHRADEDELYEAMDWLQARQQRIENKLAQRHLAEGALVMYDVTSTYFEGRTCRLARLGKSRDGKPGKLQIEFGLVANGEGCPVSVEVFEGNMGDPKTFTAQVAKLRRRFGFSRVVYVGDRGMITDARIRQDLRCVEGLDWVTALRGPAIRKLVETGSLQLSLFDDTDLGEIQDPAFPGERLIVCRNPYLGQERARKRVDLLEATERELDKIVRATRRAKQRLKGKDNIALRVGKVVNRYKMAKHFTLRISDDAFHYQRNRHSVDKEAALDGIYVIRTSVGADTLSAEQTVRTYKNLSIVERAFRCMKTVDLKTRPIHHRKEARVRAHVFLCMLAYYVEWHMRKALAPVLFDDDDKQAAEQLRESIVGPAQRSRKALRKAATKQTEDGQPVHSFQTLLRDLATVARNLVQFGNTSFECTTTPTRLQQKVFDLLEVTCR